MTKNEVNYVTFNQDALCVAMGMTQGYQVYTCLPQFASVLTSPLRELVGLVEMLYNTSLVAEVAVGEEPGQSPRKLKIINTKRQLTICDLLFPTLILKVSLTRDRMVVLLEDQIYIYDITTMKLLHTIETLPNPSGIASVSADDGEGGSYLAYPLPPKTITHDLILALGVGTNGGHNSVQNNIQLVSNTPNRVGDVIMFNLSTLQPLLVIEAHKAALAALALSSDGRFLATASDKGTIIRVFDVVLGLKLFQFRRGTYLTRIYNLRFSQDNHYVLATLRSGTVHIFRCGDDEALATKQKKKGAALAARPPIQVQPHSIPEESVSNLPVDNFVGLPTTSISVVNATASITSAPLVHEDFSDDLEMQDSDSDEEFEPIEVAKHRKLSTGLAGLVPTDDKTEPIVDQTRLLVARLIRHSSQTLGRKAAQKMGDFLPLSFSLILEPTRHFALIKIPQASKDISLIAAMHPEINLDLVPQLYLQKKEEEGGEALGPARAGSILSSIGEMTTLKLLHVLVATLEGVYYVYGLDPERGGDCILLEQHSMLEKE